MHRSLLMNGFCRAAKLEFLVYLCFGVKNAFTAADHEKICAFFVHSFCFCCWPSTLFVRFHGWSKKIKHETPNCVRYAPHCGYYLNSMYNGSATIPLKMAFPIGFCTWTHSLGIGRIFLLFDFLNAASICPLCKRRWMKIVVAVGPLLFRVQCFYLNIFQAIERNKSKVEMQQM